MGVDEEGLSGSLEFASGVRIMRCKDDILVV